MRRNERINSVPYILLENLQMQDTISLKIESPLLHHKFLLPSIEFSPSPGCSKVG